MLNDARQLKFSSLASSKSESQFIAKGVTYSTECEPSMLMRKHFLNCHNEQNG